MGSCEIPKPTADLGRKHEEEGRLGGYSTILGFTSDITNSAILRVVPSANRRRKQKRQNWIKPGLIRVTKKVLFWKGSPPTKTLVLILVCHTGILAFLRHIVSMAAVNGRRRSSALRLLAIAGAVHGKALANSCLFDVKAVFVNRKLIGRIFEIFETQQKSDSCRSG